LEDNRIVRWNFDEMLPEDDVLLAGQNQVPANSGAGDPRAIGFEGHRRVIADMCDAVADNRPPLVAGDEGRKAVALIEAIYAAARSRTRSS
jgi:predicted dehydrogenase